MKRRKQISFYLSLAVATMMMACSTPDKNSQGTGITAPLQFKDDRTFKIAQFTDIHLHTDNQGECEKTHETIEYILETEKPDLSVLTGDIVNSPAPEGWQFIADIFTSSGVPWAVTLGNHDDEDQWSREQIFDFLEKQEGFVGLAGPELSGAGNYIIPVNSAKDDSIAALLYFFDSHGYPQNGKHGSYDWIKFDQINWYREQSSRFTASNYHIPFPALAFFHIPLPEYTNVEGSTTFMGLKEEGVYSADINSGLFSAFVEMQDVMGTFVGHDHDNNYIGIHHDVALAFGQVSGFGGYGRFPRGARIIELKEGQYAFNTWITTLEEDQSFQYNYPLGDSFRNESFELIPAAIASEELLKNGIGYKYFEGKFKHTTHMQTIDPVKEGTTNNFNIDLARAEDHFGFEFSGFIKIPSNGLYRFFIYSDDGSALFIADSLVVDNDGSHSPQRKQGSIALQAGYHPIRVVYFEDYMGQVLNVGIAGLTIRETRLPDDMLYIF